jgi:dTDP-4-amino-4,6-dideoxygalactose transaminase
MEKLALFGGRPAMRMDSPKEYTVGNHTVERMHAAVEAARLDWNYLSALSGAGPIAEFEAAARDALGVPYALAVSSCTAALYIALQSVGVRAGDEVIIPAYSWPATATPVLHMGAVPVVADIDPLTYTIDPESVISCVGPRTRAVVAVHLYGQPADLPKLVHACKSRSIPLIEDCAQAFGANIAGRAVGTWGDAGCYSLGCRKPLTGGEGGLIVTRNTSLYRHAIALSQHPLRIRFDGGKRTGSSVGDFPFNFRIHPFAAIIASSELAQSSELLDRRSSFYSRLSEALRGIPGIRPPDVPEGRTHAWYRYCPTFLSDELADWSLGRDVYLAAVLAEGVPIAGDPVAVPLHRRPGFRRTGAVVRRCPATHFRCYKSGLSIAPWLPLANNDQLIDQIQLAFHKVAASAEKLAERTSHRATGGPNSEKSKRRVCRVHSGTQAAEEVGPQIVD